MNIRHYFILLILTLINLSGLAQVTTNPAFIPRDHTGKIEILFDATQGTGGMVGASTCYAHTGVITTDSKTESDWKHAPNWLDNSAKYKLESLGSNQWKLEIPNMRTYYGLAENEEVLKLAFVFRDATGSKEGKATGGKDIMVTLHDPGLKVAFTKPTANYALPVGSSFEIAFAASATADLSLLINNENVYQVNGATQLTYSKTFGAAGDYRLQAQARLNGELATASLTICVVEDVVNEPRPTGMTDGINYHADPTQATLVLYAPGKLSVFAIGDFSDWGQQNSYQMKRDGDYWWITLTNLVPGQEYGFQYLVNSVSGSPIRIGEPYCEKILHELDSYIPQSTYPDLKTYPSDKTSGPVSILQTAQVPFDWQVSDFKVSHTASLSVYELLIRDFTEQGDLDGVMAKLDYLQNLGVTAIELMPCQEFSGNDSWGYNPIFYFAMDKAYGTKNRYKEFIDECHRRGMAVFLDVVYNQADQDMPFVKLYFDGSNPTADNPWFNVSAPHPYSVFYDFNHESTQTRTFVKRNLKFLLEEYKFDGFRFDLTKGFTNKPSNESNASVYDQSRIDILTDYYRTIKQVNPDAVVILEHFCSSAEEKVLAQEGMLLWNNQNGAYGSLMKGYNSNIASMYANGNSMPFNSQVGYMESHDEERLVYLAKSEGISDLRLSLSKRMARSKISALYSLLVPGPKMIWQFGEMGYDISIMTNGRTGKKPPHWEYLNIADRKALTDVYQTLLCLRKNYPYLFDGTATFHWTNASSLSAGSRIEIAHPEMTLIAIANFSQSNTDVNPAFTQTGTWQELIAGQPMEVTAVNKNLPVTLGANSARLYASKQPDLDASTPVTPAEKPEVIYPNPTYDVVYLSGGEAELVYLFSAQGVVLKKAAGVSFIDLSDYPAGNYWISVVRNGQRTTLSILKQ